MRQFVDYPDRDAMMLDLADMLTSELSDCLRRHESASFCVPGGTTPGPIFDVLSEQAIDWDRVVVFLNDERWVPEDHERSNTKLLKDRLFVSKAAAATLVPYYRPAPPPQVAVTERAAALEPHLPISVLLLGMGADMHTASLFPSAPGLEDALAADAPNLVTIRPEDQPEPRVTLSARVLNGAMSKHIVITGDEKRAALDQAAHLSPTAAPIRAVWSGATVHWAP
ncbi:MAG: 6-phosphogluconolactonase [Pseudomonadota bacterium]